ncbi:MAG: preprotein translocase subunit SecA, partial [Nitrospirae bacterium]
LRIFGSDRISKIMLKLGMEEGVPIEAGMVTRAIENAQKKVEAHHFEIRKQLLDYDDVLNKQREVVYERRRMILRGDDLTEEIRSSTEEVLDDLLAVHCPQGAYQEEWDLKGLADACYAQFGIDIKDGSIDFKDVGFDALRQELLKKIDEAYKKKELELGAELLRLLEKMVMLRTIDTLWKDHLLGIDSLREGIGLRGYGQKDPLIEYKREAFEMFAGMMNRMKRDVLEHLFRVQVVPGESPRPPVEQHRPVQLTLNRGEAAADDNGTKTVRRGIDKVGRNDPCPCGSGKKYKKCHGT